MAAKQRTLKPGENLFREGDPSNAMFLVSKGSVSIRKRRRGGEVELAVIYSGEMVGELSFFDRGNRSASAMAITDVEVTEIDFESLEKIYANVPDYLRTMMASVSERLRRANDQIRKLKREFVTRAKPGEIVDGDDDFDDNVVEADEQLDATQILAAAKDFSAK